MDRTSLAAALGVLAATWFGNLVQADELSVDYPALVSRADLTIEHPVSRSEEGLPIGNGRMGTLLWTEGDTLRMQINRVDVFGNSCVSSSFPQRNSDYCGGCGFVDINFGEPSGPRRSQSQRVHRRSLQATSVVL